jgi:tRNA_anti-like
MVSLHFSTSPRNTDKMKRHHFPHFPGNRAHGAAMALKKKSGWWHASNADDLDQYLLRHVLGCRVSGAIVSNRNKGSRHPAHTQPTRHPAHQRAMSNRRTLMTLVKTLTGIVLLVACLGCTKSSPPVAPDLKMESDVLGIERDHDLKKTDEKYKGKTLEVSGRINRIETIDSGPSEKRGIFVTVRHQIRFRFPDSEKATVAKLQVGDIITVQGVYTVDDRQAMWLDQCRLVSTTR